MIQTTEYERRGLVVVVWTERDEDAFRMSARFATKREVEHTTLQRSETST
jgi:uncharacterized DUF497 family protein